MKFNNQIIIVTPGVEVFIPKNITLEFKPEDTGERAKVLAAFLTVKNVANGITLTEIVCRGSDTKHPSILWHIAQKADQAIISVKCDACHKKGSFVYNHMQNIPKNAHKDIIEKFLKVMSDQTTKPHFIHYFVDEKELEKALS